MKNLQDELERIDRKYRKSKGKSKEFWFNRLIAMLIKVDKENE